MEYTIFIGNYNPLVSYIILLVFILLLFAYLFYRQRKILKSIERV
ncbi:MAG: hypothetical protein QXQ14_01045 [Candidatus Aenigmatarchaeota archaeon]